MKDFPYKKILPIICLAILVWLGMGHMVKAGTITNAISSALGIGDFTIGWALTIFGYIIYFALTIISFGLSIAAIILNFSIYLTTHLDIFIKNTPAIYQIWAVIRDIASMFLIFSILVASIQMILNIKPPGFGTLIKNIIVAGILINFSFFFTQVLIDASNIVSLQFYNAMSSSSSVSNCEGTGVNTYLTCVAGALTSGGTGSGGIANVFMGAMDITQWWGNKGQLQNMNGSQIDVGLRLIIINSAAIAVTIFAALSFIGAAAVALWRVVVLILLLAFSPLWIAGFVLPQFKKEVSEKWWNHLKANLIFLPVYFFLMYVVVKILVAMNLNSLGLATGTVNGIATNGWYVPYLQLSVGFAVAIFLINLPLVTALQFSGATGTITEKFSNWAKGWVGRNTVGRTAYKLNESDAMRKLAEFSPTAGIAASKALSKVSSASFGGKKGGYEGALKQEKKDIEAMHKRIGDVERSDYETQKEYDNAKDRAKQYQAAFRSSLISPNISLGGYMSERNILNRLMASRGKREASSKLSREALASELRGNYGKRNEINEKIRKEAEDIDRQIKELARNELAEATLTDSEKSKLTNLREQKVKISEKYKGDLDKIQNDIDEGEKVKGGQDMEKLAKELLKKAKENEEEELKPKESSSTPKS
jgi:hypothetical protein